MKILFAEKCAWRAIYLHRSDWCESQIARLGIDPDHSRSNIFFAIYFFPYNPNRSKNELFRKFVWKIRKFTSFEGRIRIPFVGWKMNQPKWKTKWQQFIQSLDGRF